METINSAIKSQSLESEEQCLKMDLVVIGRKEEDPVQVVVDADISHPPGAPGVENGDTEKDSSNAAAGDPLRSSTDAEHQHHQAVSPSTQATSSTTAGKKRKAVINDNDNASSSTTDMQKKVKVFDKVFEKHCRELQAFIEEFGHLRVPLRYPKNPSFGQWCTSTRCPYTKLQKRMPIKRDLSQDKMERLEEIGFQWTIRALHNDVFEQHCAELEAFKEEFGHCNVSYDYKDNPSLGLWCSRVKTAYQRIQKKKGKTSRILSRLEEIGFQWSRIAPAKVSFEDHCAELEAFKEKFGHCNISYDYKDNPSLLQNENSVPENTKWTENNSKSITSQDRAIGRDWLPIEGGERLR